MTAEEKEWLSHLNIPEAAGLEPEEYDPEYMEEDWDSVRAGENWTDSFIFLLVEGFDKQWTSEEFYKQAVNRQILL